MTKEKQSLGKRIWLWALYILGIWLVFIIIVFLRPVKEESKKVEIKKSDWNVYELQDSDKQECINWLKEYNANASVKNVKATRWTNNNTKDIVNIEWKFLDNEHSRASDRQFSCSYDLTKALWKHHNWMFVLMVDWDIVEQDID